MKRLYLLGIALALAGCQKEDPEAGLPPATHEGKSTGGCLINGERFVAAGWGAASSPIPSRRCLAASHAIAFTRWT